MKKQIGLILLISQLHVVHAGFILMTHLYNETDPARMQEYITCLERNLANKSIDRVHVVYDTTRDDGENKLFKFLQSKPISLSLIKGRPSYGYCFNVADTYFPYARIILCNGDIYFNKTLDCLKNVDMSNNIMVALTRWDVLSDGSLKIHSQYDPDGTYNAWGSGTSQDAWIFMTPFGKLHEITTQLGTMTCDSLFAYHAKKEGIHLFNPCHSVQACHLHLSDVRHYDATIADGPILSVPWMSIEEMRDILAEQKNLIVRNISEMSATGALKNDPQSTFESGTGMIGLRNPTGVMGLMRGTGVLMEKVD